jgi:periplasmic copper chaperone A
MKKVFLFGAALIILFQGIGLAQPITNKRSEITITKAWLRPSHKGGNSALYFVIQNNSSKPDTLFRAQSKLADIVEVHESYKKDNDKMGMRPVKFISIEPNSKIEFKPGGFHVMLLDMAKDFKVGDRFEATIYFKHSGRIKVKATVKEM